MTENSTASEFVAPDLMNKMEEAAVSAARDILTVDESSMSTALMVSD